VAGKPIMGWQLELLREIKVKRFFVVVGYRKEKIQAFLESVNQGFEIVFLENEEYDSTGCSYSMMKAFPLLERDVIYLNSDLLARNHVMRSVAEAAYENCIAARLLKDREETILQKIETDGSRRLRRMDLTLDPPYDAEGVGPVKLSLDAARKICSLYEGLEEIRQRKIRCYTLFGLFAQEEPMHCVWIDDEDWQEINTSEDYAKACTKWARS